MPGMASLEGLTDRETPIPLTSLTDCGGCAAKLGADLLAEALAGLGAQAAPDELLAGLRPPDDAAVYLVAPRVAVVATLDFFPPLVDDAWTYGAIAAANATSDVFAMGGRVLFGLSIAAFPERFPREELATVLAGAADKLREAGGVLAGGHTIRDEEPKYGLAVIGVADPDRLLRKDGARPGDVLVLTKRLGTGLIVSGRRRGRVDDAVFDGAVRSMLRLNRAAAEVLVAEGVRGATDVTGFGLLGHACEMARTSRTAFVIDAASLPALPGALGQAAAGLETDGARHNRRSIDDILVVDPHVELPRLTLALDPQTSGGLLAAVAPARLEAVLAGLRGAGVDPAVVGHVDESPSPKLGLV